MDLLEKNLSLIYNGLTAHEKNVQEYIISTFFDPLPRASWENVEREMYKQILTEDAPSN